MEPCRPPPLGHDHKKVHEDDLMIIYRCACGHSWSKQKLMWDQLTDEQKDRQNHKAKETS